jgi:carbon monoxide dehydrogenase subunit G
VELQHTFTVPIPVDQAWTAFNDLEGIAPCFPGAQITSVDGDDFTGLAKVKLGPISLQYTGSGRFVERDESAYRAVIEASGKDKRGNGTAAATITARLEEEGPGTRVVVDTDLKITGRPAQFGRGVITDVGNKLLDQFATCLSQRLGQPEAAAPAPAAQAPAEEAAAAVSTAEIPAAAAEPAPPAPAPAPAARAEAPPAPPPAPRPLAPPGTQGGPVELDLGAVVGPALARRYGPTVLACLVTAVLTWWLTRRRGVSG